jgi:deoxyribodipyrimidine photo-lyase
MPQESVLVWFRLDLRLADHRALTAAAETGLPIVPVFIWSPQDEEPYPPGAASRWWLHQSLTQLDLSLRERGSRLIVRSGPVADTLLALAQETGARRVFRNRIYEPPFLKRESQLAERLKALGVTIENLNGSLLFDPGSIRTTSGTMFQVFTPFWRACWNERGSLPKPLKAPASLAAPARWPASLSIAELELEPKIDWAGGIRAAWTPGEKSAHHRLLAFAREAVTHYLDDRDRTDHDGTSRLSPHLHFGEISPLQVWHAVDGKKGAEGYQRQLAWREFSCHLLAEFPKTPQEPFNQQFLHFPWRRNQHRLRAWQKGETGFPFIDAAMRQLWATGWMHNRARLGVASFLVKHLLVPWQDGAAWFLDTLVDADLANNTMGWQWTAGCGVDAAPYFRVFNPILQGEKFDPDGSYVRQWVPELRELPAEYIHQPWNAPPLVLQAAQVRPGENYPKPLVDHATAREAALAAFAAMKTGERKA